ncbi:MAG: hypothetical protein AB2651_22310 [Candidatus Thiodiazotropha sp.]
MSNQPKNNQAKVLTTNQLELFESTEMPTYLDEIEPLSDELLAELEDAGRKLLETLEFFNFD